MDKNKTPFYFDIRNRSKMPFQIFIGGRGVGKTYSAMVLLTEVRDPSKFIYVRRTAKEIDACGTAFGNPFKKVNNNLGTCITPPIKKTASSAPGVITYYKDYEKVCGYGVPLSTFAGLRSIDMSDIDIIVFDEFIPEKHLKKMKGEGTALLNLYETINRNRELEGGEPVKLYLLANAINLSNPILEELGAISEIQAMLQAKEHRKTIPEKRLYIELVDRVGVTDAKRDTALYALANQDFIDDALTANFLSADLSTIVKNPNLKEYKPVCRFGKNVIFQNNEKLHICQSTIDCASNFPESAGSRFKLVFAPQYRNARAFKNITFDSYVTQVFFDNLMAWDEEWL